MKVFVTGPAGFIGYHLCDSLLRDGQTVAGYDGLTSCQDQSGGPSISSVLRPSRGMLRFVDWYRAYGAG